MVKLNICLGSALGDHTPRRTRNTQLRLSRPHDPNQTILFPTQNDVPLSVIVVRGLISNGIVVSWGCAEIKAIEVDRFRGSEPNKPADGHVTRGRAPSDKISVREPIPEFIEECLPNSSPLKEAVVPHFWDQHQKRCRLEPLNRFRFRQFRRQTNHVGAGALGGWRGHETFIQPDDHVMCLDFRAVVCYQERFRVPNDCDRLTRDQFPHALVRITGQFYNPAARCLVQIAARPGS